MARVLLSFMVAMLCFASSLLAQDTTPPTINCPGNATLQLAPGDCETQYFFAIFATDNAPGCTPNIAQTDGTGYTSGSTFPIGTTTLSFQATDCSGNSASCSFSITVVAYQPPNSGLVCDDFLNISIPATCEMWLTPDQALEGNYGCYDDFVVDVEYTGSNYIGYYYVGETITFTVTNTLTGNYCWGLALVEDKSGPLITDCSPDTINCLQDVRPVSEGGDVPDPTFTDCNAFTVSHIDMVTQGACSDVYSQIIMRIWSATDVLGFTSTCNQIITVERTSLLSLDPVCPAEKVMECVPGLSPDTSPTNTGYPTVVIDGVTYEITEGANAVCNITASFSDLVIPKCGVGFRIIRTWTVLDWCLPVDFIDNPWTCTQVIHYNDTTAPQITPPANMTVSANLPGCKARPVIPASLISDCSNYTVAIFTPSGPISGNGGQVPAPGLSYGLHTLTVKATDACGNSSSATFTVNVVDNIKPTPVCDQFTVVALNDTGYGFANAISFDNGSTDNCCIDNFQVARMTDNCGIPANLVFDGYVEFCCSDVGTLVQVILKVLDCHGNFNTCMVNVDVQDKTGPSITCPPNVTLTCGDDYTNPTLVGEVVTDPTQQGQNDGLATDNCGANLVIAQSDAGTIQCGAGTIYRTWAATDPAGTLTFCVQTITVINDDPFTGGDIIFPIDVTLNGCSSSTDPGDTGSPVFPASNGCYVLVVGMVDEVFTSVPDACRKILRRWTVIDWCQYNPNQPNSPGRWEHVQVIKIIDSSAPTFATCNNLTFCNFKADCSELIPDLTVSATDSCSPSVNYSWTVDLNDDGLTDPGYVTSGIGQNTTHPYPVGTHRISYAASDGCGNTGFCNFLFAIDDCKKPTPVCNAGIIIEIMPTGMVPVNVSQLEEGSSFDNCTAANDLLFSFSPDVTNDILIFTCDDLGTNLVQVWATDEAGNQDFCETQVIIQDNMAACGGTPLIAMNGQVADEENEGVENVQVELNGNLTGQTVTSAAGGYQFANLPIGYDYTVTPLLNESPLNGVTTFDLLLLHRHILNMQLLDSPYKLIAGDVNHSEALSVTDVVELRKLILHITNSFPNNTSWRFVDDSYTFPNPANPFAQVFPEVCNVNNLTLNSPQVNFVAVKIGDLNGNAATNNLTGGSEDRTNDDFIFKTAARKVKAGEAVTVDFSANLADMLGYQFTLNFDKSALRFEKLAPAGSTSLENFGLSLLDEGVVTASWYQLAAAAEATDEVQFSLTFTAVKDGSLSEFLNINSRYTTSEGYESDGTVRPVSLEFSTPGGSVAAANTFELFQNVPNPFNDATVIGFQLPEASSATLTVFDLSGRVVKSVSGDFSKGYHEVSLERSALPTQGIFYYRLETPGNTATRKMTML
ncbi:MAG: HYR domain-containing protein [Bacteroidetes bacterium]|nr:HYR domain-containing protein [Bacteroidota bacterium]